MNKKVKKILIGLLCIIVLLVASFTYVFRKDIKTINSITKLDDYGLYYMDYYSDYGLEELIANGGANNDTEIVEFVVDKILKGIPLNFEIPDFGCTTFQVQNSEDDFLFARNYDLAYVPSMIIKTEPENGYDSIAVANISIMGYDREFQPKNFISSIMSLATPYTVMDGMNEKGFSIAVLIVKDEPTNQIGKDISLTTTAAIRYMLDNAASVQEAIELFDTFNMKASANTAYHFQIADATGDSAIIEYIDNEINVIRKGEKPMVLTNFFISDEKYGIGKGQDRYDIVIDSLKQSDGVMEMDEAMDVLKDASKNIEFAATDDEIFATQWSAVYNNTDLTMDICVGGQFDKVYSFNPFSNKE